MLHGVPSCRLPLPSTAIALVIKLYILLWHNPYSSIHPFHFYSTLTSSVTHLPKLRQVSYEHSSPLHPALWGSQVKEEKRGTVPFHPQCCLISWKLQSNFSDMAMQTLLHRLLLTPASPYSHSKWDRAQLLEEDSMLQAHSSMAFRANCRYSVQTLGLAPSPSITLLPGTP